jgi:hypothetical protein
MKKSTKQNIIFIGIGVIALFLLLVFSGLFLVVGKGLTETEAKAIMTKYSTQGYICSLDSNQQIKYSDCELYHWTTGVNAGTWQIDCADYDYGTCGADQIPVNYVYCLVGDTCRMLVNGNCISGIEYKTGQECILAKAQFECNIPSVTTTSICNKLNTDRNAGKNSCSAFDIIDCQRKIPSATTTTQKVTTSTTATTTTSNIMTTTTTAITPPPPELSCYDTPLNPDCYDCKSYQEVKKGECRTTFHSILVWIRNGFVGLFS